MRQGRSDWIVKIGCMIIHSKETVHILNNSSTYLYSKYLA